MDFSAIEKINSRKVTPFEPSSYIFKKKTYTQFGYGMSIYGAVAV
jgi:hypothetical protein